MKTPEIGARAGLMEVEVHRITGEVEREDTPSPQRLGRRRGRRRRSHRCGDRRRRARSSHRRRSCTTAASDQGAGEEHRPGSPQQVTPCPCPHAAPLSRCLFTRRCVGSHINSYHYRSQEHPDTAVCSQQARAPPSERCIRRTDRGCSRLYLENRVPTRPRHARAMIVSEELRTGATTPSLGEGTSGHEDRSARANHTAALPALPQRARGCRHTPPRAGNGTVALATPCWALSAARLVPGRGDQSPTARDLPGHSTRRYRPPYRARRQGNLRVPHSLEPAGYASGSRCVRSPLLASRLGTARYPATGSSRAAGDDRGSGRGRAPCLNSPRSKQPGAGSPNS